jgi:CHAT domain-containing protein
VLCVSQTHSVELPSLPGTLAEKRALATHFPSTLTFLDDEHATTVEVAKAMRQHAWVHFSCHGIQDRFDPINSAFMLHDGRLTLSQLIRESTATAELAFLSACETATGSLDLPDEAIHLSAGMLAVGYKAVVGTMWSINDSDAPLVADVFYANLLDDRRCSRVAKRQTGAAYALDEAVRELRERVGEDEFSRWVPFVHFGA